MTIQEAAAQLRGRKVSSAELAGRALESARKLDSKLKAFITITEEAALAQARRADEDLARGIDRGPLHGIPIALKDVFCTRGIRTTCGSALFTDYVPDRDATVTRRLAAAGAVLIGKTNMHELALGITSSNPHFGFVHNPWDLDRVPGGSSGGSSAAVASGIVFMAMGSDTGGSIRIPASFCGIVGLKPTFGRVSRYGVLPLDFSLDHMGPLTRSVRDAALTLNALAGQDSADDTSSRQPVEDYLPPASVSIAGLRIGLPSNFFLERLAPEVKQAVEAAAKKAEQLGARVVPVPVPDVLAINTVGRIILHSEASALMEPLLRERHLFGSDVLALLDQGRFLPATDYVNAQRLRRRMKREFGVAMAQVDCLFTPVTPTVAPKIGQTHVQLGDEQEDVRLATTRLVRGINVLGLPALSVPCGFNAEGLPIGLQIIGKPFQEALILRVGAALEDAGDFRAQQPLGI